MKKRHLFCIGKHWQKMVFFWIFCIHCIASSHAADFEFIISNKTQQSLRCAVIRLVYGNEAKLLESEDPAIGRNHFIEVGSIPSKSRIKIKALGLSSSRIQADSIYGISGDGLIKFRIVIDPMKSIASGSYSLDIINFYPEPSFRSDVSEGLAIVEKLDWKEETPDAEERVSMPSKLFSPIYAFKPGVSSFRYELKDEVKKVKELMDRLSQRRQKPPAEVPERSRAAYEQGRLLGENAIAIDSPVIDYAQFHLCFGYIGNVYSPTFDEAYTEKMYWAKSGFWAGYAEACSQLALDLAKGSHKP